MSSTVASGFQHELVQAGIHGELKCLERFGTDIVFQSLGVDPCVFGAYAQGQKKRFHDPVTGTDPFRHFPACLGEEYAAIRLAGNKPFVRKPSQHLGNSRLGHPKTPGEIDLTRFLAFIQKIGNQFHIILDKSVLSGGAIGTKPFRMSLCIRKSVRCAHARVHCVMLRRSWPGKFPH
ncbi:hypothetical protein EDC31_1712 [Acidomonas methanolica]|nr:hypothetical protein EDC31_1712 [Acidomonas methanolica]